MNKEKLKDIKLEVSKSLVSSFYVKNKLHSTNPKAGYWNQFFSSHQVIFITFPDATFAMKFMNPPTENKDQCSSTAKKALFFKMVEKEEGGGVLDSSVMNTNHWRDNWKTMFLVFKNNRMQEEVEPRRVQLWQLKERLIAMRNIKRDMDAKKESIRDHQVVILSEKDEDKAQADFDPAAENLWHELTPKEERHFFVKKF